MTRGVGGAVLATCLCAGIAGCGSERNFGVREHTDTFQQAPNNEVDILFVVDDSCSMTEEQDALAAGFTVFAAELEASATAFHLGVITTSFEYDDPTRGRLLGDPPFLTPEDDYRAEFPIRAQVGIEGADKEKGLEAAAWALSPTMTTGPNAGFLRRDAELLIVFVSDEEDCSDEGALHGHSPDDCYHLRERLAPISTYVDRFQKLKASRDMVQVGAIVGVESPPCADSYPGRRYHQTVAAVGGRVGDICQSDWDGMLGDLGLNATGIRTSFQLTHAPVEDTLVVEVDGEALEPHPSLGWTYDAETWFLHFADAAVPSRGSEIVVTYTIDPSAPPPSVD